jgi:hypothetical protein
LLSRQCAGQCFGSEFVAKARLILKIRRRHFTCDLSKSKIPLLAYTSAKETTNYLIKTIRNWTGLVALAACTLLPAAQAKEKTLYDRLGGKKAITAVVDEFVGHVAADTRINSYFAAAAADPQRLASFKMKLVDQICHEDRTYGHGHHVPAVRCVGGRPSGRAR